MHFMAVSVQQTVYAVTYQNMQQRQIHLLLFLQKRVR